MWGQNIRSASAHSCEKVTAEKGPLRKEKGGRKKDSELTVFYWAAPFKVYMLELEFKDAYPEGSSPNGNFLECFVLAWS